MENEEVLILERGHDISTPEAVIDVELQTHEDTTEKTQPEERRTETLILSTWKKAMEDENKSLIDHGVRTQVCNTKNTVTVSGKWCLTLKYGPDGQVTRQKARYVARGFTQIGDRDIDETYAPNC